MIFLTVGSQMPFDRLVRAVDAWAGARDRDDVFAQVGRSSFRPQHFRAVETVPPELFKRSVKGASGVVAHAGTGTIITALQWGRPLLVLPRRGALGETRNDHQVATARRFEEKGLILAAYEEDELPDMLDRLERFEPAMQLGGVASPELLDRLREFAGLT